MKIKRDYITGLTLVAVGLFFAFMTSQLKTPFSMSYPGSKMLPGIAVFGLIVCGLGVFVNGLKQKDADTVFLDKKGLIKLLVSFLILCVYILAMKYVGFLIATPFITFAIVTYFSKDAPVSAKLVSRIIYSILVTAVIYLMYVQLFGMSLPEGLLFG